MVRGCPGKRFTSSGKEGETLTQNKLKWFQQLSFNFKIKLNFDILSISSCNILRVDHGAHEAGRDWVRARVNLIYTFCSQLKSLEYVIISLVAAASFHPVTSAA